MLACYVMWAAPPSVSMRVCLRGTLPAQVQCVNSAGRVRLNFAWAASVRDQHLARHMAAEDFYVRYYVGHKGKFGHEFLEFELRPDGKVTYIFCFLVPSLVHGVLPNHRSSSIEPILTALPVMQLRYANNSNYKNDSMIRKVGRAA